MLKKVVEGKDGMLFLDNDSNEVMRQITGEMKAGAKQLAALHEPHAERRALCANLGIAYRHVICPNKESIETARLPKKYRYEGRGPSFLAQYLAACPAEPPFYDRAALMGMGDAYFWTDSHWTDQGALAYLRAALSHWGDARALERLEAIGPVPVDIARVGDLGSKIGWPPENCKALRLSTRSSEIAFEGSTTGEGYVRLNRSDAPANAGKTALVLHDSFATALYRFVAECYEEALFIHTPDLDTRYLARMRPDVLWFFQAERFLPRAARNDVVFSALVAECERRKGKPADGSLFLERAWPDPDGR